MPLPSWMLNDLSIMSDDDLRGHDKTDTAGLVIWRYAIYRSDRFWRHNISTGIRIGWLHHWNFFTGFAV